MSKLEPIQSSEESENVGEVRSTRELDEATLEPITRIENMGSVEQSETIESALKEVVDASPETQAGGKLDDSQGKYEEPLKELDQELPHQEKLGHQERLGGYELPGDFPGGESDMPGSKLPGMDNMPSGEKLPGSDMLGMDSDLPGENTPDSDFPGMDGLPGGDILGGFKPDGGDMPGGLPGGDLPSKSGVPGEGGGVPAPPNIYEYSGDKGQKEGQKGQKAGEKGQTGGQKGESGGQKGEAGASSESKADVNISADVYTPEGVRKLEVDAMRADAQKNYGRYSTIQQTLNKIYDSGGSGNTGGVIWNKDVPDEDAGGGRVPPEAIEVRPGMIPGEEITDPPSPDMADSSSEVSKPEVHEMTTVDPDMEGGRVPPEAIKVRPGMIPGQEITDPPSPDLAGKSSEDVASTQSGADLKTADSDEQQTKEGENKTGDKGA
jgi:hypothetical protein